MIDTKTIQILISLTNIYTNSIYWLMLDLTCEHYIIQMHFWGSLKCLQTDMWCLLTTISVIIFNAPVYAHATSPITYHVWIIQIGISHIIYTYVAHKLRHKWNYCLNWVIIQKSIYTYLLTERYSVYFALKVFFLSKRLLN